MKYDNDIAYSYDKYVEPKEDYQYAYDDYMVQAERDRKVELNERDRQVESETSSGTREE